MRLHLNPFELQILKDIFRNHPGAVVFGSRISGKNKPYSDIDICFMRDQPVPDLEMALLREKCEDSTLPFIVDIIDYHKISDEFKRIVDKTSQPFKY